MARPRPGDLTGDAFRRDALRERLRSLAANATLETSTRNLAEIPGYAALLPPGRDVYITWLPGMPWHHLVSVARALRHAGLNPVPHLAARRLASRDQAAELLASLRDEAAVERVLLIGGDQAHSVGPYADTLAVLRDGLFQEHGIRSVGLGAYPEGHPAVPPERMRASLEARLVLCRESGIDAFLVSQFCFDGMAIHRWLMELRGAGIGVPVRIGIAGPARLGTLLRFAGLCGVGASLRALGGNAVSLTRLALRQGPEPVVAAFLAHDTEAADASVAGLHLFSFGGVAGCARWIRAVAEGRFRLDGAVLRLES